jgi:hypothetical protein
LHRPPDLRAQLSDLAPLMPAQRWRRFEDLIENLFKRGHFRTERKSQVAGARQIDLVASRGAVVYLVEVKWESEPVDVGGIDGLYARLDGTPATTTGVFVSPSGFTSGLRAELIRRKGRPILLVGPQELVDVLDDPRSLAQMLQRKFQHYHVTGEVLVGPNGVDLADSVPSTWGIRQPYLISADGRQLPWISSAGGFGEFVFAQELVDVDWVPSEGRGVCLDLRPSAATQEAVLDLVNELVAQGWLSVGATWVLEQFDTAWHGLGWSSFVDAIVDWDGRYESLVHVHHREQFCIGDSLDGRLLVLTGDLSAREERACHSANLSFHLQGIPLDPEPYLHLAESIGDDTPAYWRPLSERSIHSVGLWRRSEYFELVLDPVAFVVEEHSGDADPVWVRGLVITNPFAQGAPEGVDELEWPGGLRDTELVVCSLGQWHPLGEAPERYELRAIEWTNTTEFSVVRVVGDWRGELVRVDGSTRVRRR